MVTAYARVVREDDAIAPGTGSSTYTTGTRYAKVVSRGGAGHAACMLWALNWPSPEEGLGFTQIPLRSPERTPFSTISVSSSASDLRTSDRLLSKARNQAIALVVCVEPVDWRVGGASVEHPRQKEG